MLGSPLPCFTAVVATFIARARISAGSRIVETSCGPIEYATAGDGPPVLVVHGAGGGFDQGMDFSEPLVQSGFRVIAMSRFGYLRTPVPVDASATAQADAHACLLDALGVSRATIVGASAGAPSSMQFALRHPERTAALVLLVPAAYPMQVDRTQEGAGRCAQRLGEWSVPGPAHHRRIELESPSCPIDSADR